MNKNEVAVKIAQLIDKDLFEGLEGDISGDMIWQRLSKTDRKYFRRDWRKIILDALKEEAPKVRETSRFFILDWSKDRYLELRKNNTAVWIHKDGNDETSCFNAADIRNFTNLKESPVRPF